MTPTVGRIVHYVSHGTPPRADGSRAFTSECRAAIVTEAGEGGEVGLCVLNPTGQFFNRGVPFEDARGLIYEGEPAQPVQRTGGTWHWPERAE